MPAQHLIVDMFQTGSARLIQTYSLACCSKSAVAQIGSKTGWV